VREFSVGKDAYGGRRRQASRPLVNSVPLRSNFSPRQCLTNFSVRALAARNFFDHGGIPKFSTGNDFGGSLGGPLKEDNTLVSS